MTKRIAIDVTALPKRPVGAGQYIVNLVHEIFNLDHSFDIYIISHEDDFFLFGLPDEDKKKFIFVPDRGRAYRIFWEQLVLPRILKKLEIELLHCVHYTMPFFKPCKVVTTIHDMTFFLYPQLHIWIKRIFFRFFIRYSSRNADLLISISYSTKNDLMKTLKVPEEKIFVTSLGKSEAFTRITDQSFLEKIRFKYDLPEKFILFVGLIEPRKNVGLLIEAFINSSNGISSDYHLVIAGRWGWEKQTILSFVENSEFSERIHFPGYIAQEDLPALFNLADLFVYPSYYEGFGLPVLEAMASGTPVITSNTSSMPEFVGNTGILVEPNNRKALEEAIIYCLVNEDTRTTMANLSYLRAKDFSWRNTALKTLEVYRKILNEGNL